MKKIYVAGKYSADNIIQGLHNMREGMKASAKILKLGYAPFCPFLDYQFSFFEDITVEEYYAYSMAWLEVSDEVWVLPGREQSKGVKAEIKRAGELKIPVNYL
jgi:hypothetical protein